VGSNTASADSIWMLHYSIGNYLSVLDFGQPLNEKLFDTGSDISRYPHSVLDAIRIITRLFSRNALLGHECKFLNQNPTAIHGVYCQFYGRMQRKLVSNFVEASDA
jgi:hypothetical protein